MPVAGKSLRISWYCCSSRRRWHLRFIMMPPSPLKSADVGYCRFTPRDSRHGFSTRHYRCYFAAWAEDIRFLRVFHFRLWAPLHCAGVGRHDITRDAVLMDRVRFRRRFSAYLIWDAALHISMLYRTRAMGYYYAARMRVDGRLASFWCCHVYHEEPLRASPRRRAFAATPFTILQQTLLADIIATFSPFLVVRWWYRFLADSVRQVAMICYFYLLFIFYSTPMRLSRHYLFSPHYYAGIFQLYRCLMPMTHAAIVAASLLPLHRFAMI